MRNILIFTICLSFFGCNKDVEKSCTIKGSVNNINLPIAKLKTPDSIYIDTIKNGVFSFTIPVINEKYVALEIGDNISLYVKPNDSIFIDYNKNNTYKFTGRGFNESDFLYRKNELIKKLGFDDPRKIDITLFSSKPKTFKTKIDSVKQIRVKQIEDYKKQHSNLSTSFYNIEKQLINYFEVNQLFLYPTFNEILTKSKPDITDNYFDFTEQIEPNRRELYPFFEYKSAIKSLLNLHTKTLNEKYNLAKKTLNDSDFFEEIMYGEFNTFINFNGIDEIDSICVEFIKRIGDNNRKVSLKNKYNNWKKLAKGQKAPNFEIKDTNGNLVRLSDFKESFVYIDCWNSYCGPCIAEMPAMKKLADELKNKRIVFISISSDEIIDRWLSKVKDFNMNTINLCTEGARHKFNNDYNAKAFPRYILIDDKGFIIDATAEKPSEIKEKLEQLL